MPVGFQACPSALQQLGRGDAERGGQLLYNQNSGISRATFDIRNVGPVNVGLERELFLTPAFRVAEAAQVAGEALTNIHSGHVRPCRRSIYRR